MRKLSAFLASTVAMICLVSFAGCHSKQEWASIFTRKGDQYSAQQKYDLALNEYNKAIQIDSRYKQAYWGAALVCHKLGELRPALERLNTVVIMFGADTPGSYEELRGDILYELKDFRDAQVAYKNAMTWQPDCERCKDKLNSLNNILTANGTT